MVDGACSEAESFRERNEVASKTISFDKVVEEEGGRHNPANVKAAPALLRPPFPSRHCNS